MQIKTITTAAGVNEIDFGNDDSQTTAHFYWFKNLSDSTLYVSAMPDPVAGADNVAELSVKGAASVETDEGKVYVLGAGKVEIHRTNSKFCPFELPSTSSGGGGGSITVDSELSETSTNPLQNRVTTAAINKIKSDIKTLKAISNPNLLINPDFSINQRGISGTFSDTGKYFVDRWRLVSGTATVNSDGTLTLNGSICQPLENAVGANVTASVSAGTAVYDNTTQTFTITGNGDVISWAKLEYGNAATAFIPPDPATELMKCMRYYEVLMSANCDRAIPAALTHLTLLQVESDISFMVPKRAAPSLVSEGLRVVCIIPTGVAVAQVTANQLYVHASDIHGIDIVTTVPVLNELPSCLFAVTIDTLGYAELAVDAEIY